MRCVAFGRVARQTRVENGDGWNTTSWLTQNVHTTTGPHLARRSDDASLALNSEPSITASSLASSVGPMELAIGAYGDATLVSAFAAGEDQRGPPRSPTRSDSLPIGCVVLWVCECESEYHRHLRQQHQYRDQNNNNNAKEPPTTARLLATIKYKQRHQYPSLRGECPASLSALRSNDRFRWLAA